MPPPWKRWWERFLATKLLDSVLGAFQAKARARRRSGCAGCYSALPSTTVGCAHIEAVIHGRGQIMIGAMKPICAAAVAQHGHRTLAKFRCKPNEALVDILGRLDAASP